MVNMDSTAPAAPSKCPMAPLQEDTAKSSEVPNNRCIALTSISSPWDVKKGLFKAL
jgi:hypothetical protein